MTTKMKKEGVFVALSVLLVSSSISSLLGVAVDAHQAAHVGSSAPNNRTFPGLDILWRLDVSSFGSATPVSVAADQHYIYVGTANELVAVHGANGAALWRVDFSNNTASANVTVRSIVTLRQYPAYVYCYCVSLLNETHYLSAFRVKDGRPLGTVALSTSRLAYNGALPKLWPTDYGLVFMSLTTIYAMDPTLSTLSWKKESTKLYPKVSPNSTWPRTFSRLAASGSVVAALYQRGSTSDYLLSFDAETGDTLCSMVNVTGSLWPRFYVTREGFAFAAYEKFERVTRHSVVASIYPRIFHIKDPGNCSMNRTATFNTEKQGDAEQSSRIVFPSTTNKSRDEDNALFLEYTSNSSRKGEPQWRNWTVTSVAMDLSGASLWQVSLCGSSMEAKIPDRIVFGRSSVKTTGSLSFFEDVLAIWGSGTLLAVNKSSGESLWRYNGSYLPVPAGSHTDDDDDPTIVYPLEARGEGGSIYLVTLRESAGYIIIDVLRNKLLVDGAAQQVYFPTAMHNTTSGTPYLVFFDEESTLVAVSALNSTP